MDDSIRPNTNLNDNNTSSQSEIENVSVGDLSEFQWFLNKRHTDGKDGLLYESTRLGINLICAWRKRVLKDGRLENKVDGPYYVRYIAQRTQETETS